MQYKTISYKQIRNLGNYQSETLEITVELSEGEDINEAIKALKTKVFENLYPEFIHFDNLIEEIQANRENVEFSKKVKQFELEDLPY